MMISLGASGSRITNLGLRLGTDNGSGILVRQAGWRIDHCRFENFIGLTIEGVLVRGLSTDPGSPVGVVNHCEFFDIRVVVGTMPA